MSKTKPAAEEQPDNTAEPAAADPRDAELEALRAELARVKAAQAEPAATGDAARDRTMEALRAELDAIRSTPEGAAAELARAVAALDAKVSAMAAGVGLVPVPERTHPDPVRFGVLLECGDTDTAEHPNATHHHCTTHGTVRVRSHWELSPEMLAAANGR